MLHLAAVLTGGLINWLSRLRIYNINFSKQYGRRSEFNVKHATDACVWTFI
jgi:hypothetical protein